MSNVTRSHAIFFRKKFELGPAGAPTTDPSAYCPPHHRTGRGGSRPGLAAIRNEYRRAHHISYSAPPPSPPPSSPPPPPPPPSPTPPPFPPWLSSTSGCAWRQFGNLRRRDLRAAPAGTRAEAVVSALAKRHARLAQRPHRRARAIKGSVYRRRRRLRDGELQRLDKASKDCRGLNRYYVPLAIYLAIETGTRLQEIFNLTWRDMDPKSRRIEIHNSKTDHLSGSEGRTIVLTPLAGLFLMRLEVQLSRAKRFKLNNRIFPLSKEAMKQI